MSQGGGQRGQVVQAAHNVGDGARIGWRLAGDLNVVGGLR